MVHLSHLVGLKVLCKDHGPAGNGRSFMYEVMCEDECDEGRSCVCSVDQLEMLCYFSCFPSSGYIHSNRIRTFLAWMPYSGSNMDTTYPHTRARVFAHCRKPTSRPPTLRRPSHFINHNSPDHITARPTASSINKPEPIPTPPHQPLHSHHASHLPRSNHKP